MSQKHHFQRENHRKSDFWDLEQSPRRSKTQKVKNPCPKAKSRFENPENQILAIEFSISGIPKSKIQPNFV